MKRTVVLSALLAACVTGGACGSSAPPAAPLPASTPSAVAATANSAAATAPAPDPVPVVREFYQLYLKNLTGGKSTPPATLGQYLTERMLKEQKDTTDEDVIIRGSDFDEAWAHDLNVAVAGKPAEGKAQVVVELKSKEATKKLNLMVLAQGNTWKIDEIKLQDTAAAPATDTGSQADQSNVTTQVVKFNRGATSADYEATISQGETHVYVLNVRKGQYFGAQTYSDDDVEFKVRRKNGEELENPPGSTKWGGEAPASGDYEIVISGFRKPTKYSITLSAQ